MFSRKSRDSYGHDGENEWVRQVFYTDVIRTVFADKANAERRGAKLFFFFDFFERVFKIFLF